MEQQLDNILPIRDADNDGVLSATGVHTIGFEVTKPEIFTLAAADYEELHGTLLKALRVLPEGTMLHFQDWYERRLYEPGTEGKEKDANGRDGRPRSFLETASDRYFAGRPWLEHRAYLFVSKIPAGQKAPNSAGSMLLRKHLVAAELLDPQALRTFADTVSQFASIVDSGRGWRLRRLQPEDWWSVGQKQGLLERYCYLSRPENGMIRDISFANGIRIGTQHCQLFTVAEASQLPGYCTAGVRQDNYSTDGSPFVIGSSSPMGVLLDCNHLYNQYILIADAAATLKEMEERRLRLESMSKTSRGNAMARDAVNDFLNEAVRDQRMPVKAHFNVLAWSDDATDWRSVKNAVSRAMVQVAQPNFTWTPPSPVTMFNALTYDVIISEVADGQSLSDAIQKNLPVQQAQGLTTPFLTYPLTGPQLDTAKTYAWQVIARNQQTFAAKSEVWSFRTPGKPLGKTGSNFVYIVMNGRLSGLGVSDADALHLKYISYAATYSATVSIRDDNGKVLLTAPVRIRQGDNFLDVPLNGQLTTGQRYTALLPDPGGKLTTVTFVVK